MHKSDNFDLVFDRKVQGYADTEFYQDLHAFTISFWLKVKKDLDTGTVMSYSYGNEECKLCLSPKNISNLDFVVSLLPDVAFLIFFQIAGLTLDNSTDFISITSTPK